MVFGILEVALCLNFTLQKYDPDEDIYPSKLPHPHPKKSLV
jgi:hypothetical protein